MGDRSFRGLFLALALTGLLLDQASKYVVFHWLQQAPYDVIPGVFNLEAHHAEDGRPIVNQGALFGFLRDHGTLANNLFAAISLVAAAGIGFWATRRSAACDFWLSAALGLIMAGVFGNLYDRIVFSGVRDFLHLHYRAFDWPVFNVADSCLVGGMILLVRQAIFSRAPDDKPALQMQQTVEVK